MQLQLDGSKLTIRDNIKSVEHFQQIKTELDSIIGSYSNISLYIPDSLSITSSVIGYLMKLVHKENIRISITAGDDRLISLLQDLGLNLEFNVKKA